MRQIQNCIRIKFNWKRLSLNFKWKDIQNVPLTSLHDLGYFYQYNFVCPLAVKSKDIKEITDKKIHEERMAYYAYCHRKYSAHSIHF